MRGTAENQIKFISKKLVRSFFIDRKLDYLFSLLAADVYYLGAGKNMYMKSIRRSGLDGSIGFVKSSAIFR